jgi:hypothetical protein
VAIAPAFKTLIVTKVGCEICLSGQQGGLAAGFWRRRAGSETMERRVFNTDVKNGVEKKKVQSVSRAIMEGFSALHSGMCVKDPRA